MMSMALQPPISPLPTDLMTGSKSSKSSSFHSSSHSSADGTSSDITNFEDIGLDEDPRPRNSKSAVSCNQAPCCSSRTLSTMANGDTTTPLHLAGMRDLTNADRRSTFPNLHVQHKGAIHSGAMPSLGLPNGKILKRGFASSSTPSLAIQAMSNLSRSRSPSPSHLSPYLLPPRLIHQSTAPQLRSLPSLKIKPPVRRGSWQPSRKSIKELEDEYDESDEGLPEDATLWNVPLSPRPGPERKSISPIMSPVVSPCADLENYNALRSSVDDVRLTALRSPMMGPAVASKSPRSESPPVSPISPLNALKISRNFQTNSFRDKSHLTKTRSKSWNVALSELSDEAKALTDALEKHADVSERKQEELVQNGRILVRPNRENIPEAKKSSVELPPLRKNDAMIDPLPVSKEKEKVLSRTRPSWLPPKDPKEEKKHLKEYQRIMAMSLEAEKKKAAGAHHARCAQDDTKKALLRIWEEHVLPNWDKVIREPRTRELWWRGVAPRSRARVWQKAIENDLALTEATYEKALQRSRDMEIQISKAGAEEMSKEKVWFAAIRRDIKAVFPELQIFQPGGPLHDGLVDVLMAYSMYRSDVGYSHGTHLIAALLALTMPTTSATFLALANLLNRPLPLAFLIGDQVAIQKSYSLTLAILAQKLPRLHSHLFTCLSPRAHSVANESSSSSETIPPTPKGLGLAPALVLEPMFRTLFLAPGSGLGVEKAVRVWDVMMLDGDQAIIRVAVAVLAGLESRLYGNKEEVLRVLGWNQSNTKRDRDGGLSGDDVSVDDFMKQVRTAGKEEPGGHR